jgi:hypothetical protein
MVSSRDLVFFKTIYLPTRPYNPRTLRCKLSIAAQLASSKVNIFNTIGALYPQIGERPLKRHAFDGAAAKLALPR